jgi:hypothetical protein
MRMRSSVLKCGLIDTYAIAPLAILRRTDFRVHILGRVWDLDSARSHCVESQTFGRFVEDT